MSSIAIGRYRSISTKNPRGGYSDPSIHFDIKNHGHMG
jgi:hypothetical protein